MCAPRLAAEHGALFADARRPTEKAATDAIMGCMTSLDPVEVSALAINVTIPEELRWTDTRRGETFTLSTLNVRLLRDGRLAARAYGRPVGGGRGTYTSFPVPADPAMVALISAAAERAGALWSAHRGLA